MVGDDFDSPSQDYMAIYAGQNGRDESSSGAKTNKADSQENPPLFQGFKDEMESLAKKMAEP